jgi:hypothetical protein
MQVGDSDASPGAMPANESPFGYEGARWIM